jgi:hypothetical protein
MYMKQDVNVFSVKYAEKCGLYSLPVRFKVCGGFHIQTTTGKTKKKKNFTSSVYFQFAHGK